MILADTSVWIDHLRASDAALAALLDRDAVVVHPWVVAELALGGLAQRARLLALLDGMPAAPVATIAEVRGLIEGRALHGRGIGLVDAALLASCLPAPGTRLWTRDRRLNAAAVSLDFACAPT